MAADQYARGCILHARGKHADGPVINDGTEIDSVEFAWLILDALQLKLVPLRPGDVADVELHDLEVVEVQHPGTFRLRRLAELGYHGDLPARYGPNDTGLSFPAREVDQQACTRGHL